MSLRHHPLWPTILPFIRIEEYAPDGGHENPRVRIEFRNTVTQEQKRLWTSLTCACVHCGDPIHPIRERKSGGRAPLVGHIYMAACCPLSVNVGCSRGNAAHEEYLAIKREAHDHHLRTEP